MDTPSFRPERPASAVTETSGPQAKWMHISDAFNQAVDTMKRRKSGELQSIKTPWESFNDVGLDGIDWHNMYTIAARPGVGKTLLAQIIAREAHRLNPTQDFDILHLQFEMRAEVSAMRELSAQLARTTKYLQSADKFNPLLEADVRRAEAYAKAQAHRNEFIIETAMTAKGVKSAILDFYNLRRKPILITLDHSLLVQQDATEKDKMATLYALGTVITELKRKYPFSFLVLSQLNRSIDEAVRHEKPGSHGNYPNESDIFGADALLQFSDVLMAINRPARYNLAVYGPDLFQVTSEDLLAFHFMKVRNGSPRISFYRGLFEHMNIIEVPPPPRVAKAPGRF